VRSFLLAAVVCAAMIGLVPLWIWGATGSWRHALYALKQYSRILLSLFTIGTILAGIWLFSQYLDAV
jgi:hypothetical protein